MSSSYTSHCCFSFQMSQSPNKSKWCVFFHIKVSKMQNFSQHVLSLLSQVHAQHQCTKDPRRWKSRLWCESTVDDCKIRHFLFHLLYLPATGHPQEASGEGFVWAAVSDRSSLHPEEEGGRGAHRPRQQNRESPSVQHEVHLLISKGFGGLHTWVVFCFSPLCRKTLCFYTI